MSCARHDMAHFPYFPHNHQFIISFIWSMVREAAGKRVPHLHSVAAEKREARFPQRERRSHSLRSGLATSHRALLSPFLSLSFRTLCTERLRGGTHSRCPGGKLAHRPALWRLRLRKSLSAKLERIKCSYKSSGPSERQRARRYQSGRWKCCNEMKTKCSHSPIRICITYSG